MNENASPTAPQVQSKSVLEMTFIEIAQQKHLVTDTGRILPRKYTGLSAREQRDFTRKVKQARHNLLAK